MKYGLWTPLVLMTLLTGCSERQQAQLGFQQTAGSQGLAMAVIETRNGSIEVRAEAGAGSVRISGTKTASAPTREEALAAAQRIRIEVAQDVELLRVSVDVPPDVQGGANLRVVLPPTVALQLKSDNGSVTAVGAGRDVHASTSNGRIRLEQIGGNVEARTINGGIQARDVGGDVDVQSTNGGIDLEHVGARQVKAVTTNSHIRATRTCGAVTLETTNGQVDLRTGCLAEQPFISVKTTNSAVRLRLPATIDARVRLETLNAPVQVDLTGVQASDVHSGSSSWSATLNQGGGSVTATTNNGRITLELDEPPVLTPGAPPEPAS